MFKLLQHTMYYYSYRATLLLNYYHVLQTKLFSSQQFSLYNQEAFQIISSNVTVIQTRQSVAVQREGGIPVGNKILNPYQNL